MRAKALPRIQEDALRALFRLLTHPMDKSWFDASTVGAHASTLASLETAGLIERRWANSSLRGGEHLVYRLTNRGYVSARRLDR